MGALADEYIRLRGDTSLLTKDVRKGGVEAGKHFSTSFGNTTKKVIKGGLIATGLAAGAAFGGALKRGFGRLSAIENAEAKLTGLGHSAKTVEKIMGDALKSVKGTAFGLDEAATLAATAVAAGIKPGRELQKTLGLVADAATIGGTSLSEMGAIFNQVAASNKVQGDTINQLNERGIPILKLLGDVMGKSQAEVAELASKGKVDFATFQKAMEKGLGGAALKSGNTATGAFKNMGAAFSRVGAAMLKGVFPQIGAGFNTITRFLDAITPAAARFGNIMGGALRTVGLSVSAFFAAFREGDITSDGMVGFFERMGVALRGLAPIVQLIKGAWSAFVAGFQTGKLAPTLTTIGELALKLGVAFHPLIPMLQQLKGAWSAFIAGLTGDAGPTVTAIGGAAMQLGGALRDIAKVIVGSLLPAWVQWQKFMAAQLMPIIRQLGAFFVANIIPAFKAVVGFIVTQMVPGFLQIVTTIKGLVAVVAPIIAELVAAIVGKFNQMRPQIMSIWNSVKEIITGVMFIIKEVIQAVTFIIGGIWSRWGDQIKKVVTTIFGALVTIISGVMKAIAGIIKLVVALIKGDWSGAWNAIKQIFSGVWTAIKGILTLATAALWATLQAWWAKVKSLWTSATTAVKTTWTSFWTNVKTTASTAINSVRTTITTVLDRIKAAFQTAKDNIKRIWDGIKGVVSAPIQWIKNNVYNKPLVPVWNRVADLVKGQRLSTYATGGVIPGYEPGRDSVPIMAGRGEAIMRPEWTRAVGKDWVDKANKAARSGKRSLHDFLGESVPGSQGGGIGWMSGLASTATATASGLYQKLKGWYLGGLRVIAGKALNPTKGLIDKAMPNSGVGTTVGNIGKKAIDLILDKIKSVDVVPDLGGPAGSAIASGGWASIYRILRAVGARSFTTYPGHDQGASRSRDIWPASAGNRIAETARRISSIWYVIWNRRIASITTGRRWIGYHGSNPHTSHVHVTLRPGVKAAMGGVVGQGLASGGIVKGGRGGINALIGEGKRDELVTPLPRGWNRAPGLSDDKLDRLIAVLEARGNEGLSLDLQVDVNTNEPRSVRLNKNLQRVGGGVGLVG